MASQPARQGTGVHPHHGRWVRLVSIRQVPTDVVSRLLRERNALVQMGGPVTALSGDDRIPVMASRYQDRYVGLHSGALLPGSEDVAIIETFMEPGARAGVGLEAVYMYVGHLFAIGVRKVRLEIAEFNRPGISLMRTVHIEPEAHLRSHVYAAGRWHTVVVYGVDVARWRSDIVPRFDRLGLGPAPQQPPARQNGPVP